MSKIIKMIEKANKLGLLGIKVGAIENENYINNSICDKYLLYFVDDLGVTKNNQDGENEGSKEYTITERALKNGNAFGRRCKICSFKKTKRELYNEITRSIENRGGKTVREILEYINKKYKTDISQMNISRHKKHMHDEVIVNSHAAKSVSNGVTKIVKERDRLKIGYVYFIKSGKYHKIGSSINYKKRESSYNTHNPVKPELIYLAKMMNYVGHERTLHQMYSHKRKTREWFLLSDDNVESIKKYLISFEL